ncbi:MAG: IS701 family transposase, partial [Gammaproteobacteria bacterium]
MSEFRDRFQHCPDALSPAIGRHSRRQQHFRNYCSALTLPIERKSIESIAAAVDPDHVQASHQSLHNFVTSAAWSDRAVLDFTT